MSAGWNRRKSISEHSADRDHAGKTSRYAHFRAAFRHQALSHRIVETH
jgi:hypothetical protein